VSSRKSNLKKYLYRQKSKLFTFFILSAPSFLFIVLFYYFFWLNHQGMDILFANLLPSSNYSALLFYFGIILFALLNYFISYSNISWYNHRTTGMKYDETYLIPSFIGCSTILLLNYSMLNVGEARQQLSLFQDGLTVGFYLILFLVAFFLLIEVIDYLVLRLHYNPYFMSRIGLVILLIIGALLPVYLNVELGGTINQISLILSPLLTTILFFIWSRKHFHSESLFSPSSIIESTINRKLNCLILLVSVFFFTALIYFNFRPLKSQLIGPANSLLLGLIIPCSIFTIFSRLLIFKMTF